MSFLGKKLRGENKLGYFLNKYLVKDYGKVSLPGIKEIIFNIWSTVKTKYNNI